MSGHSLGCTLSKVFSNAGSSFDDHHMLCYISYIIPRQIIYYSVMFSHDILKRIPCEMTCLSKILLHDLTQHDIGLCTVIL